MGKQCVDGIARLWTLKIGLYDITNMDRAKKRVMKYHWLEDTLFFQNLVVPRHVERIILIENIHEEIVHFGEMWTLTKVKKRFFWHDTKLNLSRNSSRFVKNVS
jgi:hypothetical protein